MEKLTKRQSDILKVLKKFIATHGYPPTVREIGKVLNLKSPATIHFHLNKLEEKGYIKKDEAKNRALEVLVPNEYGDNQNNVSNIALIEQSDFNPIDKIDNPTKYIQLSNNLIPNNKKAFAVLVQDDSMINKGILNGDIVILEGKNTANNGDIIAGLNDSNAITIKTYYKDDNHHQLQKEKDILDNVTIIGIAIGIYRKL